MPKRIVLLLSLLFLTLSCSSKKVQERAISNASDANEEYAEEDEDIIFDDLTAEETKGLRGVHDALFEVYVPTELKKDPRYTALLVAARENLWKDLSKISAIKVVFRLFTVLEFMTGSLGSRVYYIAIKQNVPIPKGKTIREASRELKDFLRSTGDQKMIFTSFANLSLENRKELLHRLSQSELNWHRRMYTTLKALYSSHIFKGKVGEALSGVETPLENPPPKLREGSIKNLRYPTHLRYDARNEALTGELDAIIVGSGVAGSIIAHELYQAGKKVLVIERGPFIHPTGYNARNNMYLLRNNGILPTAIGDIAIGTSEVAGGGSSVNFDMAFPASHPVILNHFKEWRDKGLIEKNQWPEADLIRASNMLMEALKVRTIDPQEINSNNGVLWDGAQALGRTPSLMQLTTYSPEAMNREENKNRGTNKISGLEAFLLPAMENRSQKTPVTLLVNSRVNRVLMEDNNAVGVEFETNQSLNFDYVSNDLYGFNFKPKTKMRVFAKKIILSAGTVGSTYLLKSSHIQNKNIGKGIVVHPVVPLIAVHDRVKDHFIGTQSSVYVGDQLMDDYLRPKLNYVIETSIYPLNKAAMTMPGTADEMLPYLRSYRYLTGAGTVLIDHSYQTNYIRFKKNKDNPDIQYHLSDEDKARFVKAIAQTARILFAGGAKAVLFNTSEKYLQHPGLQVMRSEEDIQLLEKNLKLLDATTMMLSGHIMSANRMGTSPQNSVINSKHEVWGYSNLYVVDASSFPASVGANPMMSIYAIGYLFAHQLLNSGY